MLSKYLCFLLMVLVLAQAQAGPSTSHAARPDVIYGTDDRQLWPNRSSSFSADWGQSVAIKVNRWKLFWDEGQAQWSMFGNEAGLQFQLCPEERFAKQLNIGNCSGFLVAPNLLATAGHCFKSSSDCERGSWIFGYHENQARDPEVNRKLIFSADQVYHCKQVLLHEDSIKSDEVRTEDKLNNDFALIELDRPVLDRQVLPLASDTLLEQMSDPKQAHGLEVLLLGHGLGLPLVSGTGIIRQVKPQAESTPILVANTDSYVGNSGSPVWHKAQAVVLGILFDGERDFERDIERGCRKSRVCLEKDPTQCQGEYIQSILPIKNYLRMLR